MFKRLMSIMLSGCTLLPMVTPIFAADNPLEKVEKATENCIVTVVEVSKAASIVTEDYENGNVIIKQIENGEVTDTVFVDRQTNKLTSISDMH